MLLFLLLLVPLAATAAPPPCPEGCVCARLSGGGREVECGLLKATLRPPQLEVQCGADGQIGAEDFPMLSTFNAASTIRFKGCPLPKLSELLVDASAVQTLVVENSMQTLNLSETHLDGLQGLRNLQMTACRIEQLPDKIFLPLKNLERMDLRENKLRALPTLPATLVSLELGQNLLTAAPQDLPKLKLLGLWMNRFGALAPLVGLPALESLDLNGNKMQAVASEAFAALPALKDLNLSKNRIRALPPALFTQNKHLRRFRMTDNEGEVHLPQGFLAQLPELDEVTLARSSLASVPEDALRAAVALVNLSLANCQLDALPSAFFKDCAALQKLDLSGNKFSAVPDVNGLSTLRELTLDKNRIQTLGASDLSPLKKLETLSMNSNGLHSLNSDAFQANDNLLRVHMDNNELSFAEALRDSFGFYSPFHHCSDLQTLTLRNNSISVICADWILSLLHLRKLDLRQNHLNALSAEDMQFVSANLEVDMRDNNITSVDLRVLLTLVDQNESPRNVSVIIDGASVDCSDCATHKLLVYLEGRMSPSVYKWVQLKVDKKASCLSGLDAKVYECPIPDSVCQQNCSCVLRPEDRALLLACKSLPTSLQMKARGKSLEISLEGADLTGNFSGAAFNRKDVSALRLSANRLISVSELPPALQILELDNNSLNHLSKELLDQANLTQRITLSGNPWTCDCDALDLLAFVQRRYKAIADLANVTCADGRLLAQLTADDLCDTSKVAVAASLAVAVAGVVLGALAAFYYKFQHQIKVWLYAHNLLLWLVTEEEVDKNKKYDAFVSYSHKDEAFVAQKLVTMLEPQFKLCIHARDWNAGDWIPDQIARSVEDSRRTLVILSPSFMESVWGRMEFRAAHQQAMSEGRARVVVVLLQDVGPLDKLDPELRAYLTMNTYLKWGDPWFWDKLRFALPHRRLKGEKQKAPRPLAIKINDKLEQMQQGI